MNEIEIVWILQQQQKYVAQIAEKYYIIMFTYSSTRLQTCAPSNNTSVVVSASPPPITTNEANIIYATANWFVLLNHILAID